MFTIFWSLINIALFIYFIKILVDIGKVVKEKLGIIATVVFAIVALNFVFGGKHKENKNLKESLIINNRDSVKPKNIFSERVILDKDVLHTVTLNLSYTKLDNGAIIA